MKVLLFDIDATLISTGGAGIRALDRAFHKLFQIETSMKGISPHGKTDPGIIREIFQSRLPEREMTREIVDEILSAYLGYLEHEIRDSGTYSVLPGILEILQYLGMDRGVLLGLATGNVETGARIKLQRAGLNPFFSFGGFGSDSESRGDLVRRAGLLARNLAGQTVEPSEIFVIGDTPRDVEAGREAGFRTVGVATGQFSPTDLKACGAEIVIRNFHEDRDHFLRSTRID